MINDSERYSMDITVKPEAEKRIQLIDGEVFLRHFLM